MDLSLYQKMIGAHSPSVTQAYINDTITHVNDMFSKSPSFKRIRLAEEMVDAIVNYTKKSTELDLLLRPQTALNKGEYVEIEKDSYLVTEFTPNEIYPKADIERCNSQLKWKNSNGDLMEYKCVVKAASFSETDERQGSILQSELVVLVQYNADTMKIKPNDRFVFGGNTYEVTTIDRTTQVYKDIGVIELIVRFTSTTTTDDHENQVADESGNSGWGEW